MYYGLKDSYGVHLDKKLDEVFSGKENGFFIELGANDGLFQSNTAFLEKTRGWKGILIEPSEIGYELCKENRKGSLSLNYACVSDTYLDEYVYGDFQNNNPMGSVGGIRRNNNGLCRVNAITLEKILDNYKNNTSEIDFLSLDTEGYELNILRGLNLSKYRPRFMLIEIYNRDYDQIIEFLANHDYILLSNFSDYSKERNQVWDGTHNDFLFTRKDISNDTNSREQCMN